MADALSTAVDVKVWVNDKECCQTASLYFSGVSYLSLLDLKKFTRILNRCTAALGRKIYTLAWKVGSGW